MNLIRHRKKLFAAILLSAATVWAINHAHNRAVAEESARVKNEHCAAIAEQRAEQERQTIALKGICRSLLRKPRVQAALEEDSIPDLYSSVKLEINALDGAPIRKEDAAKGLRFLDKNGALIPVPDAPSEPWESQLSRGPIAAGQEIVYFTGPNGSIIEALMTPILDEDTDAVLYVMAMCIPQAISRSPILLQGEVHGVNSPDIKRVANETISRADATECASVMIDGAPNLIACARLNPGSDFPAAWQVSLYSLSESTALLQTLRWKLVGLGAVFLFAALGALYGLPSRTSPRTSTHNPL